MAVLSPLAHYVHNLDPVAFRLGPITIHWYGLAYLVAFVTGYFLYRCLCSRSLCDMPETSVADFITGAALFGVMLGGRLGYALFYDLEHTLRDPLSFFRVWEGGMSSHGGMLGLVIYTFVFARRNRLSWLSIGDNLCVVAPLGLLFGRIANFINGELYGKPADVPWAVVFPDDTQPRHPSQLYEAFAEGLVLFAFLWTLRTKARLPRGAITGIFFIAYAALRIACEFFREPDPAWSLGPFSAGQALSFILIALGGIFLLRAFFRPHFEVAHRPRSEPRQGSFF